MLPTRPCPRLRGQFWLNTGSLRSLEATRMDLSTCPAAVCTSRTGRLGSFRRQRLRPLGRAWLGLSSASRRNEADGGAGAGDYRLGLFAGAGGAGGEQPGQLGGVCHELGVPALDGSERLDDVVCAGGLQGAVR